MNEEENSKDEEIARMKKELEELRLYKESQENLKNMDVNLGDVPVVFKRKFSRTVDEKKRFNAVQQMGDVKVSIVASSISDNSSQATNKAKVVVSLTGSDDIDQPLVIIIHTMCDFKQGVEILSNAFSVDHFIVSRGECHEFDVLCYSSNKDRIYTVDITISVVSVKTNNVQMNDEVVIGLDEKDIMVKSSILIAWSEFFRGYLTTDMKEKAEGRFPVKDVSVADFQEMLSIISPLNMPINFKNVEKMIELADKFVMPSLTLKCEIFLSKVVNGGTFSMSKARLYVLANQHNLKIIIALLLDRWCDPSLFRKEFLLSNEYEQLPPDMEQVINKRFVEVAKKSWP